MNQNFMQGVNSYEFDSKPKTIFQTISISLLDAYKGCKLPINIKRWVYENNIQFDQEETIYIDIPKGVDNNEIITVKDKGNKISSSNKGDIEIKIIINNDTLFERKTITLKQSLCGFSFDIKYIDGREFRINNESGNIIPNDFRKTISQFGMQRDSHIGDLIIIFEVEFPKSLKLEQIDKLNAIL
jgi:DnaJ-class molecular chaperone